MRSRLLATCALGALVGCAVQPDVSDPPPIADDDSNSGRRGGVVQVHDGSGAEALARVDENLERLRALDVFEVGQLILELPEEALNCYGPCPGSEEAIQAAEEDAALRLDALVPVAEAAIDAPSSYLCTELVDENLAALRDLAIVEVSGMIETVPANNPQCYNLPCQEDIDAATAENEQRAAKLDSIARETSGM